MRVYLDQSVCDVPATSSIAAAVNAAAALARQRGRTIVDVMVDGNHWPVERLDGDDARRAGGATEVRLASADSRDLICQAFADASGVLAEIDQLQQTAAELLQADRGVEGMNRLGSALDLWASVHQAVVMGSAMAGLDLEPQRVAIERLSENLRGMREALERRDTVALADALLYDLPEVITQWRSLLHEISEAVRRGEGRKE